MEDDKIDTIINAESITYLPGTKDSLIRTWTGVAAIDRFLATLVVLFWLLVDGSNPSTALQSFHFAVRQSFCGRHL